MKKWGMNDTALILTVRKIVERHDLPHAVEDLLTDLADALEDSNRLRKELSVRSYWRGRNR